MLYCQDKKSGAPLTVHRINSRSRTRTYNLRVMSMPIFSLLKLIAYYLGLLKYLGIMLVNVFG